MPIWSVEKKAGALSVNPSIALPVLYKSQTQSQLFTCTDMSSLFYCVVTWDDT